MSNVGGLVFINTKNLSTPTSKQEEESKVPIVKEEVKAADEETVLWRGK